MKILIDARLYGLENTGLGRYVINLVINLTKIDNTNQYVILLRNKYFNSLKLPKNWKKILADYHHYSFSEQLIIPKIIKLENPDLVHFPHFNVPLLIRNKYVVTIHDILMHKSIGLKATTLSPFKYLVKRLAYRIVFDNAIRRSHKILVPSISVKKELIEFYKIKPEKIVVTYEGVDNINIKDSDFKLKKPYFVYIGNAYPHKNLAKLIMATKILNTKCHQKVILVISSARTFFTQKIEKLIIAQKAQNFVKFLGFVPEDELGSLLNNSTAFVFPTLSEGFGLPGLEAMSAGTLVLASNIPVLKEIYKENAIYFNPILPENIASAMDKVLKIPNDKRKKIIKRSLDFVKRYSWDKMARETLNIYEKASRSDSL